MIYNLLTKLWLLAVGASTVLAKKEDALTEGVEKISESTTSTTITKVPEGQSIAQIIANAVDYVAPVAGALAVGAVIYSGVLYIISQGDPEKIAKAKKSLFWSIGGVLVIILAYTIVTMINDFILEVN